MNKPFSTVRIRSESFDYISDLLTPVAVYLRLRHLTECSMLLESVQQDQAIGRYSIIALKPLIRFTGFNNRYETSINGCVSSAEGNPLDAFQQLTEALSFENISELANPRWLGYLGYDTIRAIERIPCKNPDTLRIPESCLIIPSTVISFDHMRQIVTVTFFSSDNTPTDETFKKAVLAGLADPEPFALQTLHQNSDNAVEGFTPNMSKEHFEDAVRKSKEYIRAGDIFQVVPSQRFETDYTSDPFETYRALRRINPSPYLYHLNFDDFSIVGSSPEMLVKLEAEHITVRPIAGTITRGKTEAEDTALEQQLLSDTKELAEHMMLIDLARNDIGRVSVPGSVKPKRIMYIENYSHVKHIVSEINGRIAPEKNAIDLFRASFPAGTLSGTPKIRAMEIIDELEPDRRGIYGGCVISWSLPDAFNSCIIIRSVLFKNNKAYVQAGAGIVADSVPENEYNETLRKASAVMQAIRIGRQFNTPEKPGND